MVFPKNFKSSQKQTRHRRNARALLQKITAGCILSAALLGCSTTSDPELRYLGEKQLGYYKQAATTIDYPAVDTQTSADASYARRPRTILERDKDQVREVGLTEAIQLAIQNNNLIRYRADNRTTSTILSAGDRAPSSYDPSIQETGVLFGGRGVAGALAAFDAQLQGSMLWKHNDDPRNLSPTTPGVPFVQVSDAAAFQTQLSKQFGYGGSLTLSHQMDYLQSNAQATAFPSTYTGNVMAQYRHPLLAGAGTEFTRIAGPINQSFGGLSGVNQGVLIARINQDLSLADFETSVITMLRDVEDLYWELYLSYREYDTTVAARNSALQSWREAHRILEAGGKQGFKPSDEAQSRDFYFQARAASETALSKVYSSEVVLRRILGMSVNDGYILRPSDEPTTAQFLPSWEASLTEALTQRVELRKQKWNIKSLELQLCAAESLTRPRLDFVSGYQVNGLGDHLLGYYNSPNQFSTVYGAMTNGNFTGWNLGVEFQVPLGFRAAHAQVRNIELRLAKARDQLAAQELDISHEVAQDFQTLAVQYVTAQSYFNRFHAAQQRVNLFKAEVEAGTKTFDVLLRALSSQAEAEVAYFRSLIEYNKGITALHYHKGTLLPHDHIWLSESDWTPEAYKDALRHAWGRTHAFDAPHLKSEPAEFVAQPEWAAQEVAPIPATGMPTSAPAPDAATPVVPYESEVSLPPRPLPPSEAADATKP